MIGPRWIGLLALSLSLGNAPPAARADGPGDLAGTWTWTWKDGDGKTHRHVLDVEAPGGKLSARERFDDLGPIVVDDLKFGPDGVYFSVKRGERLAEYKGKLVGGKTINGDVNVVTNGQRTEFAWTAERAIDPKPR